LAGVVNSGLRSGVDPLILCERRPRLTLPEARVTVTYPTAGGHYLTLGDALAYLPAIDRRGVASPTGALSTFKECNQMSRQSVAMAATSTHEGRSTDSVESEETGGFTISDLARDFGVTLRTLRFYESRGLLSPARSGMTRIYSGRDRSRLALILKGKQLGFTLVEIRAMLANEEKKGGEVGAASVGGLQLTRDQVLEQLELLRAQRAEIESAIAELEASAARFAKG